MALKTGLELRVYKTYAKAAGELVAVLTDQVSACVASTAVHGGFRQLRFRLSLSLAEAWSWLNHEGGPGRHFYHAELSHGRKLAWEDRIMDVTLALEGGSFLGVDVVCYGYWSSLRDQVYNDNSIDSGSTDWTVGGPHTADEIVKEMLTDKCPDISSDQSNISANSQDLLGITFRDDDYPMDIIVDTLAPATPMATRTSTTLGCGRAVCPTGPSGPSRPSTTTCGWRTCRMAALSSRATTCATGSSPSTWWTAAPPAPPRPTTPTRRPGTRCGYQSTSIIAIN